MENYTYGLLDWDLFMMNSAAMFNLDLMKMSTYLKGQGKFVKLITRFDANELNYYNTVYIFKNVDDGYYPIEFFSAPNVEVLGSVVGGGQSMLPDEVHDCVPDMYIYIKAEKFFNNTDRDARIYKGLNEAIHLRVSRDGKTVDADNWLEPLATATATRFHFGMKTLYIHDRFITDIPGSWDAVNEAVNYKDRDWAHRIWLKYPVECYTDDEFLAWRSFKKDFITMQVYELNFIPDMQTLYYGTYMKTKGDPISNRHYKKRGGERSVIRINVPYTYDPDKLIAQLYSWFMFSMYARGRQTCFQIRLPKSDFLPYKWQVFVEALNKFWYFDDFSFDEPGFARYSTFKRFLLAQEEESPRYKKGDYDWQTALSVIDDLEKSDHDFAVALKDFNYLNYDKVMKQWIAQSKEVIYE